MLLRWILFCRYQGDYGTDSSCTISNCAHCSSDGYCSSCKFGWVNEHGFCNRDQKVSRPPPPPYVRPSPSPPSSNSLSQASSSNDDGDDAFVNSFDSEEDREAYRKKEEEDYALFYLIGAILASSCFVCCHCVGCAVMDPCSCWDSPRIFMLAFFATLRIADVMSDWVRQSTIVSCGHVSGCPCSC